MDGIRDIAGNIDGERDSAAVVELPDSDEVPGPTMLDNLDGMAVSDDEIAAVEAFLGLQAAMILREDKRHRSKAI